MLLRRLFTIVAITVLTAGFAVSVQAGPRLYDGSIIIKGFQNDTTDGTTVPFTTNVAFPFPFGANCRLGNFKPAVTSNGTWGSWSMPAYGGQVADLHTSASESVIASCFGTAYSYGSALTGKGTLSSTGNITSYRIASSPRGFNIQASEMARITSGGSQDSTGTPYIFAKDFADLKNGVGNFGVNQGPGRMGGGVLFDGPVTPPLDGGNAGLEVRPGHHSFGGTMKLLGTSYSFSGFYSTWLVDTNIAKYTWLLDYHGATGSVSAGNVVPAFGSSTAQYIGRNKHLTNITTVHATALSWTTGTVTVTATGGPLHTILARKGFDNRDGYGYGDIQMVSPMITRWVFSSATKGYYTGTIAELHLRIAPEPHEWVMLAAGISMLGLLYRSNRR
jgi:hypothetical protein